VLLVIAIGICLAAGIYMYKFAKDNMRMVNVAAKADPPLDTPADVLFPEKVSDFTLSALNATGEQLPGFGDKQTSGVHVAVYHDAKGDEMTVMAVPTEVAREQRSEGFGVLTQARSKANSTDVGIALKYPWYGTERQELTTWQKPNWTFMVHTSSTLSQKFVDEFEPGSGQGGSEDQPAPGAADAAAAEVTSATATE